MFDCLNFLSHDVFANQNVFSLVIKTNSKEEFYKLFNVSTSEFWKSHYTFTKASKIITKKLSKAFIDLLLINTIIPLKFAYAKQLGKDVNEEILNLIKELKPSLIEELNLPLIKELNLFFKKELNPPLIKELNCP